VPARPPRLRLADRTGLLAWAEWGWDLDAAAPRAPRPEWQRVLALLSGDALLAVSPGASLPGAALHLALRPGAHLVTLPLPDDARIAAPAGAHAAWQLPGALPLRVLLTDAAVVLLLGDAAPPAVADASADAPALAAGIDLPALTRYAPLLMALPGWRLSSGRRLSGALAQALLNEPAALAALSAGDHAALRATPITGALIAALDWDDAALAGMRAVMAGDAPALALLLESEQPGGNAVLAIRRHVSGRTVVERRLGNGRDGLATLLTDAGVADAAAIAAAVQPLRTPPVRIDARALPPLDALATHLVPWSMTLTPSADGGVVAERGLPLAGVLLAAGAAFLAIDAAEDPALRGTAFRRSELPRRREPPPPPTVPPGEAQEF